jgi:chromosome condensin MukBEF MukE localization factor
MNGDWCAKTSHCDGEIVPNAAECQRNDEDAENDLDDEEIDDVEEEKD